MLFRVTRSLFFLLYTETKTSLKKIEIRKIENFIIIFLQLFVFFTSYSAGRTGIWGLIDKGQVGRMRGLLKFEWHYIHRHTQRQRDDKTYEHKTNRSG